MSIAAPDQYPLSYIAENLGADDICQIDGVRFVVDGIARHDGYVTVYVRHTLGYCPGFPDHFPMEDADVVMVVGAEAGK